MGLSPVGTKVGEVSKSPFLPAANPKPDGRSHERPDVTESVVKKPNVVRWERLREVGENSKGRWRNRRLGGVLKLHPPTPMMRWGLPSN